MTDGEKYVAIWKRIPVMWEDIARDVDTLVAQRVAEERDRILKEVERDGQIGYIIAAAIRRREEER